MKKKISKNTLSIVFLLCLITLYSHADNGVTPNLNIIPTSPNTAALGAYGVVPVDLHTGTISVSVPIYEINLDGKVIPISLSYRTTGVKVAQEASSVGLGWVLNAGGCIVRNIKGLDDFGGGGFYDHPGEFFPPGNDPSDDDFSGLIWREKLFDPTAIGFRAYYLGEMDPEPDSYFYNFCNKSGEMLINADQTFYFQNHNEFLFVKKASEYEWILYDSKGYEYTFSEIERSKAYFRTDLNVYINPETIPKSSLFYTDGSRYVMTAWYLSKIKSPKNNIVEFKYETEEIETPISFAEEVFSSIYSDPDLPKDLGSSFSYYSYSYSKIEQPRISQILFDKGSINFLSSARLDIIGANKIDKIQLKDNSGNLVKEINLAYSYLGVTGKPLTCKMLLNEVSEQSGDQQKKYILNYNLGATGKIPSKQSIATDWWGYYNKSAEPNLNTGFRTIAGITNTYTSSNNNYLSGRDKSSLLETTLIGTLSSITYPTGGRSEFIYELNNFLSTPGLDGLSLEKKDTVLFILDTALKYGGQATINSEQFTIEKGAQNKKYYWYLQGPPPLDNNPYENWIFNVSINLQKLEDTEWKSARIFTKQFTYMQLSNGEVFDEIKAVESDGTYRLVLSYDMNIDDEIRNNSYFSFSMTYSSPFVYEKDKDKEIQGNGIRIKSIKNILPNGTVNLTEYGYVDESGKSSGIIKANPMHYGLAHLTTSINSMTGDGSPTYRKIKEAYYFTGQTSPLYSVSKNHVGYSMVKEDKEKNGYTIQKFHNTSESPQINLYTKYVPGVPSVYDILDGTLIEKQIRDCNNQLKERSLYTYTLGKHQFVTKGLRMYNFPMKSLIENETNTLLPNIFFYPREFEKYNLTQEINIKYFDKDSISVIKEYKYDPAYFINNSTKITDSKKSVTESILKYPFDFTDALSLKMKNNYILNQPIESIDLKDNVIIGGGKISYIDTLGLLLPNKYYKLVAENNLNLNNYSNKFSLENTLGNYTNNGQIGRIIGKDGLISIYLWSYDGQYPIAEIKNATYSEVETAVKTLFGVTYIDALSKLAIPNETKLKDGDLQKTLPKALITTYTYKPLVGMTSMTDPRGVTTTYEYDSFGRLSKVKDANGKLINTYDYHYQNQ